MSLHINLFSVGIYTRQGHAPVLGIWYDFVGWGSPYCIHCTSRVWSICTQYSNYKQFFCFQIDCLCLVYCVQLSCTMLVGCYKALFFSAKHELVPWGVVNATRLQMLFNLFRRLALVSQCIQQDLLFNFHVLTPFTIKPCHCQTYGVEMCKSGFKIYSVYSVSDWVMSLLTSECCPNFELWTVLLLMMSLEFVNSHP